MTEKMLSNLELMCMHAETLYTHDEFSRMISVNDWRGGTVPRFFLGRTEQESIIRFRHDLPEPICEEINALVETEPKGISKRPVHELEYRRILQAHEKVENTWLGPAYWVPEISRNEEKVTLINTENSYLLESGFGDWLLDVPHQQPFVAVVKNYSAVAVCASVRRTNIAHEAGVETLEAYRGKGYAAQVVSGWANAVRGIGTLPLYSTSFDNISSQKVISRLGLPIYGVDFHVT